MQHDLLNLSADFQPSNLIDLFYHSSDALGVFTRTGAKGLDAVYQKLLNHNAHMTVTVEAHHGCPVNVGVIDVRHDDNFYSRKIVLTRQSDNSVVQFGIVSLDKNALGTHVFEEIIAQRLPLGKILIKHNVLRKVKLNGLYKIKCAGELAKFLSVQPGTVVAGRTAVIDCDGKPAIGLLEIVTPG